MMLSFDDKKITIMLLVVIALLSLVNLEKDIVGMSVLGIILEPLDFEVEDNVINLNSLTLRQKIGQMIFSVAKMENKDLLQQMNIGGIYFWERENKNAYKEEIDYFQEDMKIPFFVGVDLEGCWNPFGKFKEFPSFSEINSSEEAYEVGSEQGKLMRELGFNINFSPVVDREDSIWECRNFEEDVEGKSVSYIRGLQRQGIIATAKHYPGRTLIGRDPHKYVEFAVISDKDLKPFDLAMQNNVKAVMVNHLIVRGKVDSGRSPSVVSGNVIRNLKGNFDGLILTDEVRMAGLKDIYEDERQMYIDLVNAGNDMILDFSTEPWHLYKIVYLLENAVENNEISEDRIDEAVIKILKMKGFKVKRKG